MVSSAHPGGLEGIRVLVVEDDWLLARELGRLLTSQGCIVIGPARVPAQALALIAKEQPDATILDLNLDGQSALLVAAALAAQEVPFVIVSGYARSTLARLVGGIDREPKESSHAE
jgi:DNA-binding response OmpR family regulator